MVRDKAYPYTKSQKAFSKCSTPIPHEIVQLPRSFNFLGMGQYFLMIELHFLLIGMTAFSFNFLLLAMDSLRNSKYLRIVACKSTNSVVMAIFFKSCKILTSVILFSTYANFSMGNGGFSNYWAYFFGSKSCVNSFFWFPSSLFP